MDSEVQVNGPLMWERIQGARTDSDEKYVEKVNKADLELNRNAAVDRAWDYLQGGDTVERGFGFGAAFLKVGILFGGFGTGLGLIIGKFIFGGSCP
jgi:hypothetical protein